MNAAGAPAGRARIACDPVINCSGDYSEGTMDLFTAGMLGFSAIVLFGLYWFGAYHVLPIFAVAMILFFGNSFVANYFEKEGPGITVGGRTFEHGSYSGKELRAWLADPNKKEAVSRYVFPVLIPIDILFIVLFAVAVALTSLALAPELKIPPDWYLALLLLPLCFAVADLSEDSLIIHALTSPDAATDKYVAVMKAVTGLKFVTFSLAAGQAGLMVAASFVARCLR